MTDRATLTPSDIAPEAVAELIRGRRSVSRFEPECPDESIIRAAVETARWAPNHKLTNPWHFYILGEQARDAVVTLNTRIVAGNKGAEAAENKDKRWRAVPGFLVVTCRQEEDELRAREDYAATACAIQNLMLYLHSAGVATKWTTGAVTRDPAFFDACGIRARDEYCAGMIWYGFAQRSPRTTRATVDEILSVQP